MNWANPIPRSGLPQRHHESSDLRSLRDSDAPHKLWIKNQHTAKNFQWATQAILMLQQEIVRMRRRLGGVDARPPTLGGFKGEWSNMTQYKAGDIVLFTPSGGQAGAYGCAEDPPIGTAPDTGAPYWMAFPMQTPAVWA